MLYFFFFSSRGVYVSESNNRIRGLIIPSPFFVIGILSTVFIADKQLLDNVEVYVRDSEQ